MLSKNNCLQLMCDMLMPEHIVAHSIQVYRVAVCLADHLNSKGNYLDNQLLQAAALLHDITKSRSFETAENHALTGGQQLADLGYPEVGNLVRQHVRLDDYSDLKDISEAVVVNYADKRVLHDRIVSLDERMGYIQERYGTEPQHKQRIQLLWDKTQVLEKQMFKQLPFSPEALYRHLSELDIYREIANYRKICPQPANGSR
ncbi:MAG: HD domain-containing protein [Deltaproteobacteria bacterium]|nr:HD domain-containing protein [Deltaproteobacteria bacterium]